MGQNMKWYIINLLITEWILKNIILVEALRKCIVICLVLMTVNQM